MSRAETITDLEIELIDLKLKEALEKLWAVLQSDDDEYATVLTRGAYRDVQSAILLLSAPMILPEPSEETRELVKECVLKAGVNLEEYLDEVAGGRR